MAPLSKVLSAVFAASAFNLSSSLTTAAVKPDVQVRLSMRHIAPHSRARTSVQQDALKPGMLLGDFVDAREFDFDPLDNKSIWNGTWVNFTYWHPKGTLSNIDDGKVTWANVSFMDIRSLIVLSIVAYPGAPIPLLLCAAVVVGMLLNHRDDAPSHSPDGPPATCPSELTRTSKIIYEHWCTICCTIPALLMFGVPVLLVYVSRWWPQEVFAITLVMTSAFVFHNSMYIVFFVPHVLIKMRRNMKMSPVEALGDVRADEKLHLMHWIILPNYKEDLHILTGALESIAKSSLAKAQIGVILAMEEREADSDKKSTELLGKFQSKFREITSTVHPRDLPNDPPGKASNVSWAYEWLAQHLRRSGQDLSNVLLTVADADTEFHPIYFEMLTRAYFEETPEKRNSFLYQSPVLHVKNYHRQPGPVIVGTMFTAMAELSTLADPNGIAFPYSTYSLTMALANEVRGWDPDWIAEDWHMGIKCFLLTLGRTAVKPVLLPTINYSPEAKTWMETLWARFAQAKRHALGFSDLAYFFMMLPLIFVRLSSGRQQGKSLANFWKLLLGGIAYLVKLVNVHVIIGIMVLYALLDTAIKKTMVFLLDHSFTTLFERTFFASTMFAVTACILTVIVTFTFQALYRIIADVLPLDKPKSKFSRWVFENPLLHTLLTVCCFAICGPIFFLFLAYSVWLAAVKLLFSRTFTYEVALKPSMESSCCEEGANVEY